jgi:peptidoglycan/LPS O-acetylase OafA/YrhL
VSQYANVQAQVSEKIHALTSLRFFAALYVVSYHTIHASSFLPRISGTIVDKVVSLGYVSVSFFFLLSGYILSMVYLRRGGP